MRGWKVVQSKKQTARRNKLALAAFAAIIGLLLLSQAVKFNKTLFNPWQQQSHQFKRTAYWNGDFNFNIIISGKDISLLSFNPQDQKVTVYDIPQNIYLEVSHGFGRWMLSSVYDLGESQEVGGGKLLKDTLGDFFGLPIDGFLRFSGSYLKKDTSVIISELRKNPFSIVSMLPSLKTDLTPFELIRLKMGLWGVRFDKINQINLESMDLLQQEKLADGTAIYNPDPIRLDAALSSLKERTLQSENITIAIFNSTNHLGLAQKAARLITNLGGNVIITSNGTNMLKSTQISGEKSKTLDRVKQIFEADDIIDQSNEDLVSSRAQINLFLGEDYFEQR